MPSRLRSAPLLENESTLKLTQTSLHSPGPVRSLITTAQDWPRVRAPFPSSPTFGAATTRGPLRSLPAFRPPPHFESSCGASFFDSESDADGVVGAEPIAIDAGMEATQRLLSGPSANDAQWFEPGIVDSPGLNLDSMDAAMQSDQEAPLDALELEMQARRRRGFLFAAIAFSLGVAFVFGLFFSR